MESSFESVRGLCLLGNGLPGRCSGSSRGGDRTKMVTAATSIGIEIQIEAQTYTRGHGHGH